jgi:DnaK suppressor protein
MPFMANDNQNQVLDEQTAVVDEKSVKRVRKPSQSD